MATTIYSLPRQHSPLFILMQKHMHIFLPLLITGHTSLICANLLQKFLSSTLFAYMQQLEISSQPLLYSLKFPWNCLYNILFYVWSFIIFKYMHAQDNNYISSFFSSCKIRWRLLLPHLKKTASNAYSLNSLVTPIFDSLMATPSLHSNQLHAHISLFS